MFGTDPKRARHAAVFASMLLALAVGACSTVDRIRAKDGAASETEARQVAPEDPMARPIQLAWTSARASHCGFIFDPNQLRANYLSAEARSGKTQAEMAKIERAYDYTLESVTDKIKDDLNYCNKERTAAIRRDLNRYLAGDYTPAARMGR